MTAVTPIADLARRIPIIAKLKNGTTINGRPASIDTWRATTSSKDWAENFARVYGGQVKPFDGRNSPHNWEVTSKATEVNIALIEDGFSIDYQLWSAGGCQRRCDGVTASVLSTTGPDNVEYVDGPCICDRKKALECKLKSRLTFVMPDLPFGGGCVYESGSEQFAAESGGMLETLQMMRASGMNRGVLRLENRKSSGGRRYTLAVVGLPASLDAIASGLGQMTAIATSDDHKPASLPSGDASEEPDPSPPPPAPVEGTPSPSAGAFDVEADIVDAEIVDDEVDEAPRRDAYAESQARTKFMAVISGDVCGLHYDTDVKPFLQHHYEGRSWSGLTLTEKRALVARLTGGSSRDENEALQKNFAAKVREFNDTGSGQ